MLAAGILAVPLLATSVPLACTFVIVPVPLLFHVYFSPVVTRETAVPPLAAALLSYVVSVNLAFAGTSEFTVWLLTVPAFPVMLPLIGSLTENPINVPPFISFF